MDSSALLAATRTRNGSIYPCLPAGHKVAGELSSGKLRRSLSGILRRRLLGKHRLHLLGRQFLELGEEAGDLVLVRTFDLNLDNGNGQLGHCRKLEEVA